MKFWITIIVVIANIVKIIHKMNLIVGVKFACIFI